VVLRFPGVHPPQEFAGVTETMGNRHLEIDPFKKSPVFNRPGDG